jgi:hypothetical protein
VTGIAWTATFLCELQPIPPFDLGNGMLETIHHTLETQPVLLIFLLIALGYLIGGIRFGSFNLGPVAGVLFAGLFFGHFGLRLSPDAQALGFALFIFSVGYQAGPRFFDLQRPAPFGTPCSLPEGVPDEKN